MSPRTIDQEGLRKRMTLDISQPDGSGTGIPVKQIPHAEFPRVLYKHPREPFKKIEHRNTQHEVVEVEVVPAEHLTKLVGNQDDLDRAVEDGWTTEPYIQLAPPDPNAALYEARKPKKAS